jgi:hypothetical protein
MWKMDTAIMKIRANLGVCARAVPLRLERDRFADSNAGYGNKHVCTV